MAKQIDTKNATFVLVYDFNDGYDDIVAFESADDAQALIAANADTYAGTHHAAVSGSAARVLEGQERDWVVEILDPKMMVEQGGFALDEGDEEELVRWFDARREEGAIIEVDEFDTTFESESD